MKNYGKVIEFDGYVGTIIGMDGNNYVFFDGDLIDNDIKIDDDVTFDKDIYKDIELTRCIARFVKKTKDDVIN